MREHESAGAEHRDFEKVIDRIRLPHVPNKRVQPSQHREGKGKREELRARANAGREREEHEEQNDEEHVETAKREEIVPTRHVEQQLDLRPVHRAQEASSSEIAAKYRRGGRSRLDLQQRDETVGYLDWNPQHAQGHRCRHDRGRDPRGHSPACDCAAPYRHTDETVGRPLLGCSITILTVRLVEVRDFRFARPDGPCMHPSNRPSVNLREATNTACRLQMGAASLLRRSGQRSHTG